MQKNNPSFSIVIPAYNEAESIGHTCEVIIREFASHGVEDYEILVINDHSKDKTEQVIQEMAVKYPVIRGMNNTHPNGFGFAVRMGLENFSGDAVCIVMGDLSDAPEDIYTCYQKMKEGHECVFGSRFIKGSKVIDYPKFKLVLNRFGNFVIKQLFRLDYNDVTNAFKCYHRKVILGIQPVISSHFNLTVELPLKALVRGYEYTIIPISWTNRKAGESKLKIQEMGSRYLFIILYVWLEKMLSRGDYHRDTLAKRTAPAPVSNDSVSGTTRE